MAIALLCVLLGSLPARSAPNNVDAVAVIIGNRDYQDRIPDVDFAANDADAFKDFVINVLGYDAENIIDLRDASQSQFQSTFGNRETHEGKLWRYLHPKGKSEVVVFYSGHGVPSLKNKQGYLLPVDADPDAPEINGFSIGTLLENLSKLEAKSISVYLDTCFSGESQTGMLVRGTSGITVTPVLPDRPSRMTVITASQGDQVASWDFKAKHGMFTKHLLDALYGNADEGEYGNGDGKVVLGEVKEYLDVHMTRAARRQYGRHQNAWVKGDDSSVLSKLPPKVQVASIANSAQRRSALPSVNAMSDRDICINSTQAGSLFIADSWWAENTYAWETNTAQYGQFISEAKHRRLTLNLCRSKLLGLGQPEVTQSRTKGGALAANNRLLCRRALNLDGDAWRAASDSDHAYVVEARRRGLDVQDCLLQN